MLWKREWLVFLGRSKDSCYTVLLKTCWECGNSFIILSSHQNTFHAITVCRNHLLSEIWKHVNISTAQISCAHLRMKDWFTGLLGACQRYDSDRNCPTTLSHQNNTLISSQHIPCRHHELEPLIINWPILLSAPDKSEGPNSRGKWWVEVEERPAI